MKICVVWVGKTNDNSFSQCIDNYLNRIKHYLTLELMEIQDVKNAKSIEVNELRIREGNLILKSLKNDDYVILLDDKGKQYTSVEFSKKIESLNLSSKKRVVFVIGGAFGFSLDVYKRADDFLSLSKMTFSHQMIRILLVEQIYRSMTIIKGEPYHHEDSLFYKK